MKLFSTLLALLCISLSATAQQISRDFLTSAGGFSIDENGISLSWSIGGVFCQTIIGDHHLTEGFQQGELTTIEPLDSTDNSSYRIGGPSIIAQEDLDIQVSTFPNPTADYLVLHFKSSTPQTVVAYIFDERGNFIFQKRIEVEDGKEVKLSQVKDLSAGKYFVEFVKYGKTIFTKPFIKIRL